MSGLILGPEPAEGATRGKAASDLVRALKVDIQNQFVTGGPERWRAEIDTISKSSRPLIVLLLTPRHINLLDKPHHFIKEHLREICPRSLEGELQVNVLTAVVDRIPQVHLTADERFPPSPLVPNEGSEGVSVAYLDLDDAAPDLWSHRTVSSERDSMTIQQRCSISFAVRDARYPDMLQKYQLPVANTLFLNGSTSTLMAQRWVQRRVQRSPKADQDLFIELLQEQALPEQVLHLTYYLTPPQQQINYLHSFLRNVTERRTVAASVGNIIQKIRLGEDSEAVPASLELETAIHTRIQEGDMLSQHGGMWALIAPRAIHTHHTVFLSDLLKGCRLRKVLSGGGGWGVKQGLLSLDPDSDYKSLLEQSQAPSFPGLENDGQEGTRLFEDVVNPDDTVTFYVNKISNSLSCAPQAWSSDTDQTSRTLPHQLLQFGTILSTIDAPQSTVDATSDVDTQAHVTVIENHFGMLSEQGMSFQYRSASGTPGKLAKTKLDAPFTLCAIQTDGVAIERGAPAQDEK